MSDFGATFFRKFYLDPATRVTTPAQMRARAHLIASILRHTDVPVRRILDAGCGIGLLRSAFAEVLPRARYTGLEVSEYLCARYGWTRGSVVDFAARAPFDLVVCYDVLQYLPLAEARRALLNLAELSRAAVYFSALTAEDWALNCDRSRTDRDVHLRTGAWYRRLLQRSFYYLGFGVWIRRDVTTVVWELERADAGAKVRPAPSRRAPRAPARRRPRRPARH